MVPGQVRWLPGQGRFQIGEGIFRILTGQAVHQVQVEIVEAGLAGRFDGPVRSPGIVNTSEGFQMQVVETLYAEGQPVDSGGPERFEATLFEGAGVGLEGDFCIRQEIQAGLQGIQ